MEEPALTVWTIDQAAGNPAPRAYNVRARGELDLDTSAILAEHFQRLLDDGASLITLDASGVEFMDSSGLRVIVAAGNALNDRGGQLLIEGISGAVHRVLEVSGLLQRYQRD